MLHGLVLFARQLETANTSEVTVLNNARLLSTRQRLMSLGLALYPLIYRLALINSAVDLSGDGLLARAMGKRSSRLRTSIGRGRVLTRTPTLAM